MQKILVTGSSGMLGTDLAHSLSPFFKVYGLTRHREPSLETVETIYLDLSETEGVKQRVREIKPDFVIHAAAFTKVDLCEDVKYQALAKKQNASIVEDVIDICNEVGAYLIFFSTDYIFSGTKQGEYLEDDPVKPINYYGQTKAWAEEAFFKKSNRFMIFRVTWLYGEHGNHFPGAILNQAKVKKSLSVVNDQWGRPTWTKDIASFLCDLLSSRQNLLDQYNKEVFHIGNSGKTNWSGYARHILDHKGYPNISIQEISSAELQRPARRPENSVLSLNKAEKFLGLKLRPWQEALDEFLMTHKNGE